MLRFLRASLTELRALEFQQPCGQHINISTRHVFKLLVIAEPEQVKEEKPEVIIS
jgi:hypothetical protein